MHGPAAHLILFLSAVVDARPTPSTPLEWVERWGAALTWPAVVIFASTISWWVRGYLIKIRSLFEQNIVRLQDTHTLALNTREAISVIKNNHLAHIEEAILNQKEYQDKQLTTLQDIATGIGILVDRGRRD